MLTLPAPRYADFPAHLRCDLVAHGFTDNEIYTAARTGVLTALGNGAYAVPVERIDRFAQARRHYQLQSFARGLRSPAAVVSHLSAAALHGLPADCGDMTMVHLTGAGRTGGRSAAGVHRHSGRLDATECVHMGPVRVTGVARTLVDVARTEGRRAAVAIIDAALNRGMTMVQDLAEAVAGARNRRGMGAARRALRLVDGRSESVGETYARLVLGDHGLPAPDLQVSVFDRNDTFLGRADFGYPDCAVLIEFDGQVKYRALLRPGEDATGAVLREKRREEALAEAGFVIVRLDWNDLSHPQQLVQRIRRARTRGQQQVAAGSVTGTTRVPPPLRLDR